MSKGNLTITRRIHFKNLLLRGYISKHQIRERLGEILNFHPSWRTIERDFSYLKDLGYEIETMSDTRPGDEERNKKYAKLYRIQDENYDEILFERLSNELLLSKSSKSFSQKNIIGSPAARGLHFVFELLEIIDKSLLIELVYESFNDAKESTIVAPLKIKEYLNEWHLIAYNFKSREYKIYGTNRILNIKSLQKFKLNEIEDFEVYIQTYVDRLGVTRPLDNYYKGGEILPQKIKIWVSSFYLGYLDSKPLHHSQDITQIKMAHRHIVSHEMDEFTVVEFTLIPNYDLIKAITSQLGDLILAEPQSLKAYIREKFQGLISGITLDSIS